MLLNKIINCDCVQGMKTLPDECIDLTVTSPPYDNMKNYNGYSWNFEETAKELFRITKQGGVVIWVVADQIINGSKSGTSFRQALYFKDQCGFNIHDVMIWEKAGRVPIRDRYFDIFNYMFVLSKGKPKTIHLIRDHENISAGKKTKKQKYDSECRKLPKNSEVFTRAERSARTNIWRIPQGKNPETRGHPATFPEKLANDQIITWSNPNEIVFDPFCGSGTALKMAVVNYRMYLGFDCSAEYCNNARERVNKAVQNRPPWHEFIGADL